jgi:RimJ/RimL family protein N-acetyltransferase
MISQTKSQSLTNYLGSEALNGQLRSERMHLRPCSLSDLDDVMAGLSHFDVASMMDGVSLPFLRQDAVEWLEELPNKNGEGWNFALSLADAAVIGFVSIARAKGEWVLQYWLNRDYWGQGYMTEALDVVIAAFFDQMPDQKLRAAVFADDVPALLLQQRLGFETKGCSEVYAHIRSAMVLKIQMEISAHSFRMTGNRSQ